MDRLRDPALVTCNAGSRNLSLDFSDISVHRQCSASGYLTAAPAAGSSSRRVAVVSPVLPLEDGPVAVRSQILTEDARGRQRRQLAVFRARAKIAVPKGDKNVGSDASEFI